MECTFQLDISLTTQYEASGPHMAVLSCSATKSCITVNAPQPLKFIVSAMLTHCVNVVEELARATM